MKVINIIRRPVAAALVIAAISFAGCKKNNGDDPKESDMTKTTAKEGEVEFYLAGTREVVVDWGDGAAPDTFTLDYSYTCAHTFPDKSSHTITIKGRKINTLTCDDLQLTALDVGNNTALIYLGCIISSTSSG